MPYGGVKASGVGKEGVRFAMNDLTHERILVLSGVEI
jgi:aldehyde dehydrogenase (NAD+)